MLPLILFECRSKLEDVVQFSKVTIIREKVCPDLHRLASVLHKEIRLAKRQFGPQCVIWVPLCLFHILSSWK